MSKSSASGFGPRLLVDEEINYVSGGGDHTIVIGRLQNEVTSEVLQFYSGGGYASGTSPAYGGGASSEQDAKITIIFDSDGDGTPDDIDEAPNDKDVGGTSVIVGQKLDGASVVSADQSYAILVALGLTLGFFTQPVIDGLAASAGIPGYVVYGAEAMGSATVGKSLEDGLEELSNSIWDAMYRQSVLVEANRNEQIRMIGGGNQDVPEEVGTD